MGRFVEPNQRGPSPSRRRPGRLLLIADVLGRLVLPVGELPAGIVTAFVGAPALIVLVRRRTVSGL